MFSTWSTICALSVFSPLASADFPTGRSLAVNAPVSDCSQPPTVSSKFSYLACREYQSSKDQSLYYQLEKVEDGEYIRLLARPNDEFVDATDYESNLSKVIMTCDRIRNYTLSHSQGLESTPCQDQANASP
jgi:hypothetical protein